PPRPAERTAVARAEPRPARDRPTRTAVAAGCGAWYIQAGAFRDRASARDAAAAMEGLFDGAVGGHSVREGGLTRVRVGPFTGRDAAHRALATVARQGYADAFLLEVQEPADRCDRRSV
ncbi:MAG: SPOR domain-containing protein, partial [Alphaproteobacteria bacterium]